EGECASTKRRLSAELFEHQLLNWVIEESPTCPNAGLPRASGTPREPDSRREGFVVRLGQSVGYSRVAGHHQPGWEYRSCRAIWAAICTSVQCDQRRIDVGIELTRVDRRVLSGPEGLHVLAYVRDWSIELPA